MVVKILLAFDESDFKKLKNAKETAKINKEADNWEDFVLKKCGIRE